MYHPRLRGNYYEMGFKYGTVLRRHGFKPPEINEETIGLGLKCEQEVKRVFPKVLDEIRGIADAIQEKYEKLAPFILTVGYGKVMGCGAFACVDDSRVIFGRNYDFYYRFGRYCESYLTQPKNANASLGNTDVFVGREDGVNQHGLAMSMHFVSAQLGTPGVNFPIAVRYVLDNCKNTGDAIEYLTHTKFLTANNYLVADRSGELAVVEACPSKVRVRRPETDERFIVATNHFVHPEMKQYEIVGKRDPDSEIRYNTILRALREARGHVNENAAKRILSDHEGRVCSHLDYIQLGTLWSQIIDLQRLKILRAEGQPCKTKYHIDSRLQLAVSRIN
jgi:predicted choloylglycine hydrolase